MALSAGGEAGSSGLACGKRCRARIETSDDGIDIAAGKVVARSRRIAYRGGWRHLDKDRTLLADDLDGLHATRQDQRFEPRRGYLGGCPPSGVRYPFHIRTGSDQNIRRPTSGVESSSSAAFLGYQPMD